MGKIINKKAFIKIRNALKKDNKILVFTNGCFDFIHSGHIYYLKEAKSFGDVLIVGLNSDNSTRRIKGGKRPINNEDARALVLSSLEMVDYVIIFDEDTPYQLIKMIMPDILVKGGDYKIQDVIGEDIVQGNGGKVKCVKYIEGFSTTSIIEEIKRRFC